MRWLIAVFVLLVGCTSSSSTPQNDRGSEPRAGSTKNTDSEPCEEDHVETYEEGCEGEAVPLCMPPVADPSASQWCTCEGETVESAGQIPPTKIRYRHEGPCKIHGSRGRPDGSPASPDAASH